MYVRAAGTTCARNVAVVVVEVIIKFGMFKKIPNLGGDRGKQMAKEKTTVTLIFLCIREKKKMSLVTGEIEKEKKKRIRRGDERPREASLVKTPLSRSCVCVRAYIHFFFPSLVCY